ncbi:MAG: ABC transporter ATP-binding protein [Candidatus Marinimicrobia bacterium]|nr:ABC transporter ATP-binding protein [Candidatus Neomarinimicrobiota bacterium]MBL7022611.1 ABC transporter ATP-binding protein [Candidatus Neomarinimicrobiota bacterium]MBL7109646.1 ABC transporter ATP-binding protein [Candidatus Neomarinimicrobiota bacterium]
MEASITLKSIAKKYRGKAVLADLSFGVEKGSTFVIVGENGAGKSTLLKILVGLIEKDAGMAYIHGKDITNRGDEIRSITGYMPQISNLDDDLTILEQLIIYGQLHGLSEQQAKDSAYYWADVLDFKNLLREYPSHLSFGHQRKICFARAIVHNPEVILLDEPTTGLDPRSRAKIWSTMDKLLEKKTILFTTQNFSEAERYAERIAILHHGNIKMNGTLDKLIETTHGLARYRISFETEPPEDLLIELKEYPKVIRPNINGFELEFYAHKRREFFTVLRIAMKYQMEDIDTTLCRLHDLFVGITDGGLE